MAVWPCGRVGQWVAAVHERSGKLRLGWQRKGVAACPSLLALVQCPSLWLWWLLYR